MNTFFLYSVLEDSEVELTKGKVFTVPAGTMHALRTDGDVYVSSFPIQFVQE